MARLPQPGQDNGVWGNILNDFLSIAHNADGTIRSAAVPVASVAGRTGDITLAADDVSGVEKTANRNANDGYAGLDSSGLVAALQMRPFNLRGVVAANTSYNRWDVVVYKGRYILITNSFTSGAATAPSEPFLSAANYMPIGQNSAVDAYAFGVRGDATTDNATSLQNAIDHCAAMGGGVVQLPAGFIATSQTIILKQSVWLRGTSAFGTVLKLTTNANCHVISNYTWDGVAGHTANAQWCGILDMTVDGNKDNQNGVGPYHAINFTTNPASTVGSSGDPYFDPAHIISNVRIYKAKGDGVHIEGRSDVQVAHVKASFCGRNSFYSSFDTHFVGCVSEKPSEAGFYIANSSSQFTNCKSYLAGTDGVSPNTGYGFYVNGFTTGPVEITFSNCDAQQNAAHGFYVKNSRAIAISGCTVSESGFQNGAGWSGFVLDGSNNCVVDGTNVCNTNGNASALALLNGATANDVRLTHYAASGGTATAIASGSSLTGNTVTMNGVSLTDTLAALTDVTVTTPADNHLLVYQASSSKWINVSSSSLGVGASYGNVFGDGSDGSATLDGTATVAWASKSGSTYTMTRDCHTTALTIQSGVTLIPNGNRIFCVGAVSNAGTISANGNSATTFTGASGTSSFILGLGAAGGTGNVGAGSNGSAGGIGVGNGGGGGTGSGGAGGTSGFSQTGNIWPLKTPYAIINGALQYGGGTVRALIGAAGGAGGGGDGTNRGGGGGQGGGIIAIFGHSFTNSGSLSAVGGNGFTPTLGNCGGGGSGGGGLIISYTLSAWSNTGTAAVTAGAAGSGVGTGTAGSAGVAGNVVNVLIA